MKFAVALALIAIVAAVSAEETLGQCGGSCTSSAACASSGGDILCRCVNFVCSMTEPCGGGCVMDSQCRNWDSGNDKCVCTWSFRCELESRVRARASIAFLDLIEMTKMSKQKREEMAAKSAIKIL